MSADGVYRYQLERWWGPSDRVATFVMLNPSTADASTDDRTIGRCISFATSWGLDGLRVVNLYALRSTDPAGMWVHDDPVGPDNDTWLGAALQSAALAGTPVIAAWGANARTDRVRAFGYLAQGHDLQALALTKSGAPKHPLYQRGDTVPAPYVPHW